jgi:Xaa-Pro aminopeptidase
MPFKSLGYNLGATFPPTWVDPPMIIEGEPTVLKEGMVLFLHPAIRLEEERLRMALGEQVVIRANGVERITEAPRQLCLCG